MTTQSGGPVGLPQLSVAELAQLAEDMLRNAVKQITEICSDEKGRGSAVLAAALQDSGLLELWVSRTLKPPMGIDRGARRVVAEFAAYEALLDPLGLFLLHVSGEQLCPTCRKWFERLNELLAKARELRRS